MKNIIIVFILVTGRLLGQQITEVPALIAPQGYGIKLLNSSGNSSIVNDISNIGFMNPASISNFSYYAISFSYQANSKIDEGYMAGIGTSRMLNRIPQTVAILIPTYGLNIGLSFGQRYNGTLDFDPIPITTFENPDGTGEFFTPYYKTTVYSYSIILNTMVKELFSENSIFSLGIRYSYNKLNHKMGLWKIGFDESDFSGNFAAGVQYKTELSEKRNLAFGVSYENKIDFEKKFNLYSSPEPNLRDSFLIPAVTTFRLVSRHL